MLGLFLLLLQAAPPDGPAIRVPEGFTVERVAAAPLVERPIMAAFDEEGRLYVGDSAGVNLKFEDLQKGPPHRILRLVDANGDGVFEASTVFADRVTFPMGACFYRGSLYVCAPPSVWKFTDADGDGVAERREEIVTRFGSNGNAADIHGPFLGPDGRLYWTDGRHGHSIDRPDGSRLQGSAARVFRARPDGSQVEVVCGGGMDNPVEIAFTEEGEPLVTCALFLSSPKRVDTIFHAIEGGVFPYHECIREFKRTGELLPSVIDLGWVAPSGLVRCRGDAFRDAWFTAQFNTHVVQRHAIERDGATFRGRSEDFLSSSDPDFHPTDVLEDADGSLLVVDTGGWFRIGCPTSRIDKPQIRGAIYRVRKKDATRTEDPRGRRLDWSRPDAALLDDPRFAVRDRAVDAVADPAALRAASPRARLNAVWALSRRGVPTREALRDADPSVRQAAAHVAGLDADRAALPGLIALLRDPAPQIRREAATALGRLGDAKARPALLDALRAGSDRFLEHALVFALIRLNDRAGTLEGLADPDAAVRRGALLALDQMDSGALTREQVTPFLDPSQPALQRAALSIISARGWSAELLGLLGGWIAAERPPEGLAGLLDAFSRDPGVQDLLARGLRAPTTSLETRLVLLEAVTRAPLDRIPATWAAELRWSLDHPDPRVVRQAVAALRAAGVADADATLLALARDAGRPEELRVDAAQALAPRLEKLDPALFALLRESLDASKPALLRLAAAQALGSAPLSADQLARLAPSLAAAGALELPRLLGAYERSSNPKAGKELLAALEKSPAVEALPAETLRRTLRNYPEEVLALAAGLLKRLEADLEKQKARLAELAPLLAGGDAARGREVFNGRKVACSACHAVQAQGGRVGPDLSRIATIRTGRDLLEAVIFPSASFARGYEPFLLRTKDGAVHDGLIARESPDAITLILADRSEKRVPRASIDALQPGRSSIMPQGLDAQLDREELRDLLAFLQSLK